MAKQLVEEMHSFAPALTAHIATVRKYRCPADLALARPENQQSRFRTAAPAHKCNRASQVGRRPQILLVRSRLDRSGREWPCNLQQLDHTASNHDMPPVATEILPG